MNGYVFTSKLDQNGPGWRVLGAIQIGAWIGDGVGEFTAALGLYFVLAHFAPSASLAFVLAIVGVLLIPILSAIGTDIYFSKRVPRNQGQLKPEELQTPAPPAPPEQGTTL